MPRVSSFVPVDNAGNEDIGSLVRGETGIHTAISAVRGVIGSKFGHFASLAEVLTILARGEELIQTKAYRFSMALY